MREESDTRGRALSQGQVSAKHHYRFKYLKSEHWGNLRIEKLASVNARCKKCNLRDLSNDVHHLRYRKLYDVTLDDLVVLCRKCHERAHEAMEYCKEFIKSWESKGEEYAWTATLRIMRALNAADNNQLGREMFRHSGHPHFIRAFFTYIDIKKSGSDLPIFEEHLERISCKANKIVV